MIVVDMRLFFKMPDRIKYMRVGVRRLLFKMPDRIKYMRVGV